MAGLVPAISVLLAEAQLRKTRMPATSAGMTTERAAYSAAGMKIEFS
jgi:hypothetical protein